MAIGDFSNRKDMVKEGILEHQKGSRKNRKNRNMDIYNRLFCSSWVFIIIVGDREIIAPFDAQENDVWKWRIKGN